jgi:hypothetical protein
VKDYAKQQPARSKHPEDGGSNVPLKYQWIFNGLHSITFQKTEIVIHVEVYEENLYPCAHTLI